MASPSPARFITIPQSHFCEKARWALDRVGVEYIEEAHALIFHWIATLPRGGRSVPVLVRDGRVYLDSTDILLHLDAIGVAGNLYPQDPILRREVLELEEHFDKDLGPHTRRWAYAQLLPHSRLLIGPMSANIPKVERRLLPVVLPLAKYLIRKWLHISQESATRSLARVREAFGEVGKRLSDGRTFLIGDRLTAADITFAALAGPVLFPPGYRGTLPPLSEVPQTMRDEVQSLRDTAAGQYAMRVYADERAISAMPSGSAHGH